jgi:hypothetical protein
MLTLLPQKLWCLRRGPTSSFFYQVLLVGEIYFERSHFDDD